MRRLVIDTNIVVSGLLWRGPPHGLLMHIGQNTSLQLFTSQTLLDELADVLTRPSLTKRLSLIEGIAIMTATDALLRLQATG